MDLNEFLNSLGEKAKDWMNSQNQNFGPDQNLNQRFDQNYLQNFNQSYPSQFGNQQSQIEMLAQQFYNQYNASIQSI